MRRRNSRPRLAAASCRPLAPWRWASRAASRRRALLPLGPLVTGNAGRTYIPHHTPSRCGSCLLVVAHFAPHKKNKKKLKHNSCSRQLVFGTRGPAVAHGTQSIQTWDSRPYCLLLLTAHSLYTPGTHGPAVAHGT
jgi:hypothetical protein